jgi:two-component system, OmpR family, sensor kinase
VSLQRRLVALVALLLVVGLAVADVVTYTSVRSFLYGQADDTLDNQEAVAFNYLQFASVRHLSVDQAELARRVSANVYLILLDRQGRVVIRRPSGSQVRPDPAPVLNKAIPVQQVPDIYRRAHTGRDAGSFHPDPNSVTLGSAGGSGGEYRAVAVTVPQGTLVTAISLNPTNDTLNSLRRVELLASLAILVAMGALVLVVVRRGLRPLRQMAGTADAIASGDLTRRVPEARPGTEVGRLGVALNEMLSQIETAFAEKSDSEERLRQFVADASHELRTPLTSIRGYAELLGRGGFSDEASTRRALKRIEEEAARMGGLVEDLLLLAELDQGRPLKSEPVDLHRICADAVGDSNAVPHAHHLTLEPGGPVVVLGDAERLAQVAHNLVRNALAHTPPGTDIVVSTGAELGALVGQGGGQGGGPGRGGQDGQGWRGWQGMGYIKVADNGPGIPTEELARVFDRFYQGDKSRSGAGTGLGLAIVRAIAEALHGTASVESPVRGGSGGGAGAARGATIVVRIPLAPAHAAAAVAQPARTPSPQLH